MKNAAAVGVAAATAMSAAADSSLQHSPHHTVKVHFLELKDGNSMLQKNPDLFRTLWQLTDIHQPPRKLQSDPSVENENWKGISEGDLVVFPSLLSGAGEFEAMRFVGPKTTDEEDELPLLTAGVEYPEFPSLVVSMARGRGVTLRQLYEEPFNLVLQSQSSQFSLKDIFSQDDDAYEQFWQETPVARRRGPAGGSPWRIPLGSCDWIRTLEIEGKGDSTDEKGEEEL